MCHMLLNKLPKQMESMVGNPYIDSGIFFCSCSSVALFCHVIISADTAAEGKHSSHHNLDRPKQFFGFHCLSAKTSIVDPSDTETSPGENPLLLWWLAKSILPSSVMASDWLNPANKIPFSHSDLFRDVSTKGWAIFKTVKTSPQTWFKVVYKSTVK